MKIVQKRAYRPRSEGGSIPPVGECVCGVSITLGGFTNACENCGRDYNSAGQLLAPRAQWGEETGEQLSDILRIK